MIVIGVTIAVFEVFTAKMRLFRLPELLAGGFVLALLGAVTAVADGSRVPGVSVVMACYNAERHLEAAARSALRQTRRDLELLIIDDASTDDSVAIAQRLAGLDDRVRHHQFVTQIGLFKMMVAALH